MQQVLIVVATIVVVWFAVAVALALVIGRAVRLADQRQRQLMAVRRPATRPAPRTAPQRVRVAAR